MKQKKTCPVCGGSGFEHDMVMSVAIGTALGTGYTYMNKTCTRCWGDGKVDE